MVKIELNFSNKTLFTIIISFLILILIAGVYGFGTNQPSVFGHSGGEIDVAALAGKSNNLVVALSDRSLLSGFCSGGGGSYDTCIDVSANVCAYGSCLAAPCDACQPKNNYDLLVTCKNNYIERIDIVGPFAC